MLTFIEVLKVCDSRVQTVLTIKLIQIGSQERGKSMSRVVLSQSPFGPSTRRGGVWSLFQSTGCPLWILVWPSLSPPSQVCSLQAGALGVALILFYRRNSSFTTKDYGLKGPIRDPESCPSECSCPIPHLGPPSKVYVSFLSVYSSLPMNYWVTNKESLMQKQSGRHLGRGRNPSVYQ